MFIGFANQIIFAAVVLLLHLAPRPIFYRSVGTLNDDSCCDNNLSIKHLDIKIFDAKIALMLLSWNTNA